MSRNAFMHPRNIYKIPPDYTELAIKYPKFRKICKLELNGRVTINLKTENTLKLLSQTLLLNDFQLDVEFPDNFLIPTIPLRLNYILWLEDILTLFDIRNVHGVDIGCGSAGIYSLLASRKNNWKMTGIEIQPESIKYANTNITNNNLENLINIFHQTDKETIFRDFFQLEENYFKTFDFCLCNPPFYENKNFLLQNQKSRKRKPPGNLSTGNESELICEGGEVAFVKRIIYESLNYKKKIRIFSSMLGHKKSILSVLQVFQGNKIHNFTQTEFCQGNTTRWGIAWSFIDDINLEKCKSFCIGTPVKLNEINNTT